MFIKMLKFLLLYLFRYCLASGEFEMEEAHMYLDRRMAPDHHGMSPRRSITEVTTGSEVRQQLRRTGKKLMFPSLDNYEVGATPASEEKYPWVARVVHSTIAEYPHACTALCIDRAIFITAMRCIYGLKVEYTRVLYRGQSLPARAFVLPSNLTQDAFDDIGFIVTNTVDDNGVWAIIERFDTPNRTDNQFHWFEPAHVPYELLTFKVVGYSMKKMYHKLRLPERVHVLTELNVQIGIDICEKLITKNAIKELRVPCYHSCSLHEQSNNNPKCNNYHGVEGGAVFDVNSNKLLGVATWGYPPNEDNDFPVGFAVPNSVNYFKDLTCARLIRNDETSSITNGYYQKLCDSSLLE